MKDGLIKSLGILTLCLVYTAISHAAPNGLNQIPIAKVYGDGGVALSVAQSNEGGSTSDVATTQFGLFNIAELGVDYQATPTSQRTFLANAKLLVLHEPTHFPDIAVGIQNLATGQRAVPYVVATTQPRSVGFSLGAIRPTLNGYEAMGGVSVNVLPNFQIVGDTIRGWSNYSSIGVIDALSPFFTLNVAYAMPNKSGENPDAYIVNLAYVFHLRNGGITRGRDLSGTKGTAPSTTGTSGGGKNPAASAGNK